MRFPLLRCLAKAIVKHGVKFLCNLAPGGGAVYEFAADVVEDYRRDGRENALRAELQALAQAPADQVHSQVEADVQAVAPDQPPEVRQALSAYLTQVPAAIRRSLRRPSDPSGTTVPANLALSRPEDLMAFLPPRPPRFRPGDRPLPGVDWELEELVGVGGFGEVWKARHVHLRSKAPVALKFCLDSAAAPALRNEAGVLDRVMRHGRHPGIVPLLNTYLSADPPCLEYEFVEGCDLAGLIQDLHGQGRMRPDMANRLFRHLVEIVAHAHRADPPIVHCDLKPANLLVRRGTDGKIGLRVTDFGIGGLAAAQAARETRQPTRSRPELLTDAVRGAYTPLYASPEQMTRRKGELADPRDDVHALGVIWYQMLTGDLGMMSVPPDWREQIEERGLSEDLIKLLASCIAPKAEKRPGSAIALVDLLQAALSRSAPGVEPIPEAIPGVEATPVEKPRPVPPQLELRDWLVEQSQAAKVEKPRPVPPRPEQPRTNLSSDHQEIPFSRPVPPRPKQSPTADRVRTPVVRTRKKEARGQGEGRGKTEPLIVSIIPGKKKVAQGPGERRRRLECGLLVALVACYFVGIALYIGSALMNKSRLAEDGNERERAAQRRRDNAMKQLPPAEDGDERERAEQRKRENTMKQSPSAKDGNERERAEQRKRENTMKQSPSAKDDNDLMKQSRKPDVSNSIGMKFAWCPPGTFQMGSPPGETVRDDDEFQHEVTLTKGFYLGVHEVTQAHWRAVMGINRSDFKGDNLPVEQVSWKDCQDFCKKLGNLDGKRYRLPTEAEWEYACRAGTTTPFYFGETIGTEQANYNGNNTYGQGKKGVYRQQTTPVGSFPANAWGLFDMHGNVWEWCQDRYGPYPKGETKDPQSGNNGSARVRRGGSWYGNPSGCRSASRDRSEPGLRIDNVGCRVVLFLD